MRLLFLAVIILAVIAVFKSIQAYRYRRRLASDDPLRMVSRRERREWAREQLKREQDAYDTAHTQQMVQNLKGNFIP